MNYLPANVIQMKSSHYLSNYDFSGRPVIQGGQQQTLSSGGGFLHHHHHHNSHNNFQGDHCDNDVTITSTYTNNRINNNKSGSNHIQSDYNNQSPRTVNQPTIIISGSGDLVGGGDSCGNLATVAAKSAASIVHGNVDLIKYEIINGGTENHQQSNSNNEYNVIRSTKYHHKGTTETIVPTSTTKRKRETGKPLYIVYFTQYRYIYNDFI